MTRLNLNFLSIDPGSILLTLTNTIILFLVLKHFLFKPVNAIIEQRRSDVEQKFNDADSALQNAKESEKHYNELISGAREESAQIIKNASVKAQQRSDEIITAAKDDAAAILTKAENEIKRDKISAKNEIKSEISELAVMVASKIVDKEISQDDHKRFIDEFIENVEDNQ